MALPKKYKKEVAQMVARAVSVATANVISGVKKGGANIEESIIADVAEDSTTKVINQIGSIVIFTSLHDGTYVTANGLIDGQSGQVTFESPPNKDNILNELKRAQSNQHNVSIVYQADRGTIGVCYVRP